MKTVLFACIHNAGRSQMAAAWFNQVADPGRARAISAGTEPGARVHPEVVTAMNEVGIDLGAEQPRRLTDDVAQSATLLVTMGCGEACPVVPGLRREDWPLDDPKGRTVDDVRRIRDEIRALVLRLVQHERWDATTGVLPNIVGEHLDQVERGRLGPSLTPHPPRILMLYGSLRERSYSRLLTFEAARLLEHFGADVRIFDPRDLPMPDATGPEHPKVRELRALSDWSEGQVWCSPERHGAMSGVMKSQIDWLPLNSGSVRPTQGRTLAVMQVSGGSQSFNAVNGLRLLGRWMRMFTIPNQSSVAKAFQEFDDAGRMKPSSYYDRVVDVMEELVKFTLLLRDHTPYLTDRYSERKEEADKTEARALAAAAMSHEQGRKTP